MGRAASAIDVPQSKASARPYPLRDCRGGVALLGLVAMTSILGMAGFTIDLGMAYVQQARLQGVADSAAMAGAISYGKTASVAAATATIKAVVLANGWPATVIQAKTSLLTQSPRNSAFAAIQVGLTAPSSLTFLGKLTSATSVTTTVYSVVEAGTARSASSVPTVFNTGVDAAGNVLASGTRGDPHYTLTQFPFLASSVTLIGASGAASYWTAPNTTSAWISPVTLLNIAPPGSYVYQTTFDLTGYDSTTMLITGQVAGNDQVSMQLNSAAIISTKASSTASVTFTLTTGFISGVNVLTFSVYNNVYGTTGLRVAMTGTASLSAGKVALVQ